MRRGIPSKNDRDVSGCTTLQEVGTRVKVTGGQVHYPDTQRKTSALKWLMDSATLQATLSVNFV